VNSAGNERGKNARERVLEAAMRAIAEEGLEAMRMRTVAERAGMSPGHVMYYFPTKNLLLLEALRWSEAELTARRRQELAHIADPTERLARFVILYAPETSNDPHWTIWLEVWARTSRSEALKGQEHDLSAIWVEDLADVIRYGVRVGAFRPVDADEFAEQFTAFLDGLVVRVLVGWPDFTPERMVDIAMKAAARELGFRLPVLRRSA